MPTPDYHFLYLDPALDIDWLFSAARRYWDHFRPMVIQDLELVKYVYVPEKRLIAITALARRDLVPKIADDIKKLFPKALYDPLVYDLVSEAQMTLDGRVDFDQRFGVDDVPVQPKGK